jgi:type I restriction enzyme S subunit
MNFTDAEMDTYRLKPGDLLLGEASGSPTEVGKPAIWGGEIPDCAFQNTLLRVRSRGPEPRYLLHFFRHQAETGRFAARSRGVGIFHLGRKALAELPVPLPPAEEQRRVAAILDAADELRAKRRASLALLDSLTESIFLDLFGDPVANPHGWDESESLGDVADVVSGITKGRRLHGQSTRTVPYLAVANVQAGFLRLNAVKTISATKTEIDRYRLRKGDILLTEGGDPDKLGRGALWSEEVPECIHQNHVFRVRLQDDRFVPEFVSQLLGSERGRRNFLRSAKQTTGIASINKSQLSAFPLLRPPMELQRRFLGAVAARHRVSRLTAGHGSELDDLFTSLQHRAFREEL